jgi:hypothetical protein
MLLLALTLTACAKPPPLALALPKDPEAASESFNARIKQRFPVGSPEGLLITELRREGFEAATVADSQRPFQFTAIKAQMWRTCRRAWTVTWGSDAGRIVAIKAAYSVGACL